MQMTPNQRREAAKRGAAKAVEAARSVFADDASAANSVGPVTTPMTVYVVLEVGGRVVAEYPAKGQTLEAIADTAAADLGAHWRFDPGPDYCWVKLAGIMAEPGELPLYYRKHVLPEGHCVGCAPHQLQELEAMGYCQGLPWQHPRYR